MIYIWGLGFFYKINEFRLKEFISADLISGFPLYSDISKAFLLSI